MPKALESPINPFSVSAPIPVTIADPVNIEFPGPALFFEFVGDSTPAVSQDLITQIPPLATIRKLRRIEVISRAYAEWYVTLDGNIIKEGKNSPVESTVSLPFDPWALTQNPNVVKVVYNQTDGPIVPIKARLYYTDE